jgi:NTP pyrophosphatase (non-canonical NTP hydrolase)
MNEFGFNEYQERAWDFKAWPDTEVGNLYPVLALAEEAGEVVGKVAKAIRKGVEVDKEALSKELGDVLWNLAGVATLFDIDLLDIAVDNIEKLQDRIERNVLVGEGDNR